MNINFAKNDHLTAQIEVTVEPEDYQDALEAEYKSYQKKTNLKGFRKGKTPKSMIRKMYGPALLTEIVTKKFQDALYKYLEDEEIEVLGEPIPAEDQERLDFKSAEGESFTFKFDLGLKPDVEIGALDDSYHYYDTVVPEEEIDKQINILQRRAGKQINVEEDFQDEDIVTFNAWELEDGEIKEDGLETSFGVLVEKMVDEYKDQVLEMKVGDQLDFDIFKLEKDMPEERVRKYMMKLDEEDEDREVNPDFRGEIVEVSRVELAELDEEFLTTAFGEETKTEEDARELIGEDLKAHFEQHADNLLFQEVHNKMMDKTEVELPDEFLKRWMLHNRNNNEEEQVTAEDIEENYNDQFRESLKWQLISGKLSSKYEVTVEKEEILEELGRRIQEYMPGQQLNQEVYNQILQSLAQDQQQVQNAHDQVRMGKMFKALKKDLTLDKEEISQDEFEKKLQELNEANQNNEAIATPDQNSQTEEE